MTHSCRMGCASSGRPRRWRSTWRRRCSGCGPAECVQGALPACTGTAAQLGSLAAALTACAHRLLPLQVYTFDAGGVSGHPNHLAVCVGVLRWWAAQPSSSSAARLPQLWQLESVGQLRKYLGPADVPLSCLALRVEAAWQRRWRRQAQHERVEQQQGPARTWHVCRHPRRAWRALLAHRSQMVW